MRNCYVYRCDWKHKTNPKRAMFNMPKDPAKFKQWSDVLPKHRKLTQHDRLCEKHFDPEDILRDWSHVIQGQTTKVPRRKPNLRPDAVPRFFDLSQSELKVIAHKRKTAAAAEGPEVTKVEKEPPAKKPSGDETTAAEQEDGERSSAFEDVYDNIFEVQLPSTLWGVHRDPERKYIAFTRFQVINPVYRYTTTTTLIVESSLKCCALCDSSLVLEDDLYARMESTEEEHLSRYHAIGSVLDSLEQLVAE